MIRKVIFIIFIITISASHAGTDLCKKQIITAVNPTTNSIVDFPTACDVPAGWILINDSLSFKKYQVNAIKAWSKLKEAGSSIEKKWNDVEDERKDLKDAVYDFYDKLVK